MIVLLHNTKKITAIEAEGENLETYLEQQSIGTAVYAIAKQFPNKIIVWCHEARRHEVNAVYIKQAFPHNRYMYSFNTNGNYFPDGIGYVEDTPFIKINKTIKYPSWQMSSEIGAMKASTILLIPQETWQKKQPFDFLLCSIAKSHQPLGLFCYSNPKLLRHNYGKTRLSPEAPLYLLFKFVKQHYKWVWVFLLHLNYFVYEKKLTFFQLVCTLWVKEIKTKITVLDFTMPEVISDKKEETIDVIIPTIRRKKYLYDVLFDLKVQTHLPEKVIIVEQNPMPNSVTELEYIKNENWPFEIKHIFTHQAGACNARNIALQQVDSKWVFFADDDIRFENTLIQKTYEKVNELGVKAVTLSCLQEGQKQIEKQIVQWNSFGSGCSFVCANSLKNCSFNRGYEFGFGEDTDFGMQIRNQGYDVLYLPEPKILHLKAPVGGFRTKQIFQWHDEIIQPKPSPTIMLYKIQHNTQNQILGYKTTLFFKYYRVQTIKNPVNYYLNFQKQWKISEFWANKLKTIE